MKRTLILGASMLLLLTTILLLLPTNTEHHLAVQSINFKHKGASPHTFSKTNIQASPSTLATLGSGFEATMTPIYSANIKSSGVNLSDKPSASIKRTGHYTSISRGGHDYKDNTLNQTTSTHTAVLTTLKQNNQGGLQVQTQGSGDKVYANRTVGETTSFPTTNMIFFAQATSGYSSEVITFSDAPVMNTIPASHPGDPAGPLGQSTLMLLFGVAFIGIKAVVKK